MSKNELTKRNLINLNDILNSNKNVKVIINKLLKTLERLNSNAVIYGLSIQNKSINSVKDFSYVSFKFINRY